jgi:hypothetical protein
MKLTRKSKITGRLLPEKLAAALSRHQVTTWGQVQDMGLNDLELIFGRRNSRELMRIIEAGGLPLQTYPRGRNWPTVVLEETAERVDALRGVLSAAHDELEKLVEKLEEEYRRELTRAEKLQRRAREKPDQ